MPVFGMKNQRGGLGSAEIAEAFYGSEFAVGSLLINDAGGAMPWVYIASQKPPLLAMLYLQATSPRRDCLVGSLFHVLRASLKSRMNR
jgi:hypothetical protein